MLVIPAVDLLGGKAVRLAEGDRERVTVYSERPWELTAEFVRAGAQRIHVVDLDGAFGEARQVELIRRMLDAAREVASQRDTPVEFEVGGGVRDVGAIEALIEAGVEKIVVGTLAVREPKAVEAACKRHPGKLVVAIDARDGMVAVDGWRELSSISAAELGREAATWGAGGLLYTDVARDGLQVGPAVESTAALQTQIDQHCEAENIESVDVIASGGVGTLADLDALASVGIRAVVLGRALYERNFTLEEALSRC